MSYRWPFLDFIGAADSRSYAEKCVLSLVGKPFMQQMKERRVIRFERIETPANGHLQKFENFGFGIILNIQRRDGEDLTFAHELGHTFGYDMITLTNFPHTSPRKHGISPTEFIHVLNAIEEFADTFAHIWMSYRIHRREVCKFLWNLHEQNILSLNLQSLWPPS